MSSHVVALPQIEQCFFGGFKAPSVHYRIHHHVHVRIVGRTKGLDLRKMKGKMEKLGGKRRLSGGALDRTDSRNSFYFFRANNKFCCCTTQYCTINGIGIYILTIKKIIYISIKFARVFPTNPLWRCTVYTLFVLYEAYTFHVIYFISCIHAETFSRFISINPDK